MHTPSSLISFNFNFQLSAFSLFQLFKQVSSDKLNLTHLSELLYVCVMCDLYACVYDIEFCCIM